MQQTTRSPSLKKNIRVGRSNIKKKNFDSENAQENVTVPPLKGTKRHSSPSGCPPPNPKRKALGDVTNSAAKKPLKQTNNNVQETMALPIIHKRRSQRIKDKSAQVNTPTIQPLELDENERTSVEFKKKKGVFSPEYSQSDSESLEGSPKVKACIAYDHFGIFYYHMPSQETCELCLIAGTNMEDLNKHIEEMKIPFKDVRCFAFAFKEKSETLKLKITDPIPSGWKIIGQNKCQISKKSIALFEKSKINPKYPHVPESCITMGIKTEEAIVSFKMEGIISDKKDHTSIVKDIKSQQHCGSKHTTSRYNLRSRSYSASPSKNNPFGGQLWLVSSLWQHHGDICDVLLKNSTALSSLKISLYSQKVISIHIKNRDETIGEISNLIDIVSAYINGGEGDDGIKRCEVVMECLNKEECLSDIVKKI